MAKRLIKIAKELNVGTSTIVEHLNNSGFEIDNKPTAKITEDMETELLKEFQKSIAIKEEADKLKIGRTPEKKKEVEVEQKTNLKKPTPTSSTAEPVQAKAESPAVTSKVEKTENGKVTTKQEYSDVVVKEADEESKPKLKVLGKIDLDKNKKSNVSRKTVDQPKPEKPAAKEEKRQPEPEKEEKAEAKEQKQQTAEKPEKTQEVVKDRKEKQAEPQEVKKEKPETSAQNKKEKPAKTASAKTKQEEPQPKKEEKSENVEPQLKAKQKPEQEQEKAKVEQKIEKSAEDKVEKKSEAASDDVKKATAPELRGLKIKGKIDINKLDRNRKKKKKEPEVKSSDKKPSDSRPKRPRKRKKVSRSGSSSGNNRSSQGGNSRQSGDSRQSRGGGSRRGKGGGNRQGGRRNEPQEVSQKEIEEKIKATIAQMSGGGKKKRQRIRRENRERTREKQEQIQQEKETGKLELTEFISVSEFASLMDVSVTDVITTCMNLGVIVSINQRLDAEIIELVAEEFGHEVEFISAEEHTEEEEEIEDDPEDLESRSPIVTVMGHVDHGKTSLLDYIRTATVAEGEAGGITQHIGAYEVKLEDDKRITFLDTPGHEAFTAMRARGAKVTDIAIIIIAADDNIMPQTKEAISHAQAAGVPMVFAINKIDKPGAQPERIKQELANMNFLVEEWGGKYQSQDISAKNGTGIEELLEKVLLEAELLELQANPDREAIGTVLEASLDKGRGYVTKTLIQTGTLEIGDSIVAGEHSGKVKAMFDEHGKRVKKVGPSRPVLILGLGGAPQAGERFKVVDSEQEARAIASKRGQIIREQANRATKRISLDEIGRRLALGNFKELNLIVKGDVDGSIEALSDSLIKQSIESVQVNVIHIESDVLLASASDAIIIGFQVRPSLGARKLAEREGIEIKMYSVIYKAIEEVRAAIEGMLEPTKEEKILGNVEVRETYKISKVGTVAGCYVQDGKITRNANVRVVRDGIVIYPTKEGTVGKIASLKRFKEDVKEVKSGLECGLNVDNFNDIKTGDVIEAYEIVEVKQTLD